MENIEDKIDNLLKNIDIGDLFVYFYNKYTDDKYLNQFEDEDFEIIKKSCYDIIESVNSKLEEHRISQFGFDNHYIKVYGCNGDGPEYINCEYCHITNIRGNKELYFKGVGFSSEFGPYDDTNYVHFSTWDDHYINLDSYLTHEEQRQSGKIKKDDWNYNSYRVEIITKEEYTNAFDKMILQAIDTFKKWNEDIEENKESI